MKNATDDKEKPQNTLTGIYLDFMRTLNTITKNVAIKDLKTLDINYRLINKYRKEFLDDDFLFLNNTFIKPKYNFKKFSKSLKAETNFKISQTTIEKCQQSNEIYGFIFMILLTKVIDNRNYRDALDAVKNLITFFKTNESLTTNTLKAKAYYYLALITEKLGNQDEIINELQQAYRTACIEMDQISQVTLINCIIRYYLKNKKNKKDKNNNNINTAQDIKDAINDLAMDINNLNIKNENNEELNKGKDDNIILNRSKKFEKGMLNFLVRSNNKDGRTSLTDTYFKKKVFPKIKIIDTKKEDENINITEKNKINKDEIDNEEKKENNEENTLPFKPEKENYDNDKSLKLINEKSIRKRIR